MRLQAGGGVGQELLEGRIVHGLAVAPGHQHQHLGVGILELAAEDALDAFRLAAGDAAGASR
ncbi:hypothetical protein D3C86_1939900 [compost metagenome]